MSWTPSGDPVKDYDNYLNWERSGLTDLERAGLSKPSLESPAHRGAGRVRPAPPSPTPPSQRLPCSPSSAHYRPEARTGSSSPSVPS